MAQIVDPNTGEVMDDETQAKLLEWQLVSRDLEAAKAKEIKLRNELVEKVFGKPAGTSGTQNFKMGATGYTLKCKKALYYKIDKDKIDATLDEMEKLPNGAFIAERLVKWSPELSLTEYKQLPPDHKKLIDKVLTITDATPSIEMIAPKA